MCTHKNLVLLNLLKSTMMVFMFRLCTIHQCTTCFSFFVVFLNEAHNCYVVRILHDVVGVEIWAAVRGHWVERQGAQNAALGGAIVQRDDTRVVVPSWTDCILSVRKSSN